MSSKKNFKLANDKRVIQSEFSALQSPNHYAEIHRELISINKLNKNFSQKKIEELKNSILGNKVGLIEPLRVIYVSETNTYRLVSGERRYRAIMSMTEEEYRFKFPNGIPAMITNESDIDEIEEEIALIEANALARSAEEGISTAQFERLYELYKQKNSDSEENVNMLKILSKKLNMSEANIQRIKNVTDTEPEVRELFDSKQISLVAAEQLVRVNPEGQQIAVAVVKETGGLTTEQIDELKKQYPQTRKELNQRKKKAVGEQSSIDKKEIEEKAKELTSLKTIPEVKKINSAITSLMTNKENYNQDLLTEDINNIIIRLSALINN